MGAPQSSHQQDQIQQDQVRQDQVRQEWESAWRALEDDGLRNVSAWASTGMSPRLGAAWFAACGGRHWEHWVALDWATSAQPVVPMNFLDAGVGFSEVRALSPYLLTSHPLDSPLEPTEIVCALQMLWGELGLPLDAAWQWRSIGFCDPHTASGWRDCGFSPHEAHLRASLGFCSQSALQSLRTEAEFYHLDESLSEEGDGTISDV